jgi:hypothetical protein
VIKFRVDLSKINVGNRNKKEIQNILLSNYLEFDLNLLLGGYIDLQF